MVDPIGAVSLGITVCQSLVWYYRGWSAWEDDVKSAVQDVEDVSEFLKILQSRLDKLSTDQADVASQAHQITARIFTAVKQLEEIRHKCEAVPREDGEKPRIRNFLRRSLYPFKQSTLQDLRDAVKQIRGSLTDLLQLLQIDLMENGQLLRFNVDRALKQTLSANQALARIEHKIEEISNVSQSAMRIESKADVLVDESREVCRKVDTVKSNLENLNTSIISTSQDREKEFAELNDRLARIEMTQTTIVALATTRGSLVQEQRAIEIPAVRRPRLRRSQLEHGSCSCRKRTDSYESTYSVGWLRISSTTSNISAHSRSCPYWNPSAEIKSNQLSAQYTNSALSKMLQLAIKITRGAGGLSISPLLTLRGFVHNDSPVFALFARDAVHRHLHHLAEYMDYASARMLQLFVDGAGSPYDVTEYGETILHRILESDLPTMLSEMNVDNFRKLIFTCVDAGAPLNELDSFLQCTPLEILISSPYDKRGLLIGIASELHASGADLGDWTRGNGLFVSLSFAKHIDSWCEVTNCGPLSTAVIEQDEQKLSTLLSRSPEMIEELDSLGRSPMHLSSLWPRGIEFLLQHSGGGLVNQPDGDYEKFEHRWLPMSYAFANRNFNALRLLLDAGSALSSPAWIPIHNRECPHEEVLSRAFQTGDLRFISLALEVLLDRRIQLYNIAKERLPGNIWTNLDVPSDRILDKDAVRVQSALLDFGIEIPQALQVNQKVTTVYHCLGRYLVDFPLYNYPSFGWVPCDIIITEVADSIFNSGFRDIDRSDGYGFTPLENCCLCRNSLADGLAFVSWLCSKGVSLHPTGLGPPKLASGVTGLHMIGHFVGRYMGRYVLQCHRLHFPKPVLTLRELQGAVSSFVDHIQEISQILIRSSIQEYRVDSYHCGCSASGCSPVLVLLKSIQTDWWEVWEVPPNCMFPFRERVIEWIENDSATDRLQKLPLPVAADIIRFETFEMLGLTHTCCRGSQTRHWSRDTGAFAPRFTTLEINEIREEEQCLLDDHERLVDELVQAYEQHEESLSSFLSGFWRTKMARWLTERSPTRDEDLVNMRRIGIVMDCSDEDGAAGELANLKESDCNRTQCHTTEGKETLAHDQSHERRISDEEWFTILRDHYVR